MPQSATGTVFLVGAGPGDPDLLTLRALQVLQDADIVFYDELVTDAVLDRVRRDAKRVFVGKRAASPASARTRSTSAWSRRRRPAARSSGSRAATLSCSVAAARRSSSCASSNIPVVIVPGITAALGCAAEAELPLTFRNEATRLTFITAHRADEAAAVDWTGLADSKTTVVVYMGLASAAAVRDGLIAGRARSGDAGGGAGARHTPRFARRRSAVSTIFPSSPPPSAKARRCLSSARWSRTRRRGARRSNP